MPPYARHHARLYKYSGDWLNSCVRYCFYLQVLLDASTNLLSISFLNQITLIRCHIVSSNLVVLMVLTVSGVDCYFSEFCFHFQQLFQHKLVHDNVAHFCDLIGANHRQDRGVPAIRGEWKEIMAIF